MEEIDARGVHVLELRFYDVNVVHLSRSWVHTYVVRKELGRNLLDIKITTEYGPLIP